MTGSAGRTIVVTYCSRDKDPSGGLLPAVDRYLSPRIHVTAEVAGILGHDFRILSGLYGLLAPDAPIPHYDHLLTNDEIPTHTILIAVQLKEMGANRVIFVTRPLAVDAGTGPYREVMAAACRQVGSEFEVLEIGSGDSDPEILARSL